VKTSHSPLSQGAYAFHTALIARLPHLHPSHLAAALIAVGAVLVLGVVLELVAAKRRSSVVAEIRFLAAGRGGDQVPALKVA